MSAQALEMSTRSPITMTSVDSGERLNVKPRVFKDLWISPRTSIRAIGPAFSEASRVRIDGKAMLRSQLLDESDIRVQVSKPEDVQCGRWLGKYLCRVSKQLHLFVWDIQDSTGYSSDC